MQQKWFLLHEWTWILEAIKEIKGKHLLVCYYKPLETRKQRHCEVQNYFVNYRDYIRIRINTAKRF